MTQKKSQTSISSKISPISNNGDRNVHTESRKNTEFRKNTDLIHSYLYVEHPKNEESLKQLQLPIEKPQPHSQMNHCDNETYPSNKSHRGCSEVSLDLDFNIF